MPACQRDAGRDGSTDGSRGAGGASGGRRQVEGWQQRRWTMDAIDRRGTIVLANTFLMAVVRAMSMGGSYGASLAACFATSVVGVGFGLTGLPLCLGWHVMFALGVPPPLVLATGVLTNVLMLYSLRVFKAAGISSNCAFLAAIVAIGSVRTLSIFVPTLLADRLGCRPLLLASAPASLHRSPHSGPSCASVVMTDDNRQRSGVHGVRGFACHGALDRPGACTVTEPPN